MLWTGAALLVSSGLLSFAFQWRSVARSFQALARAVREEAEDAVKDPLADIECPPAWFPLGFAILGPIAVALMAYLFQIPVWAGVLALPLAVIMGVIAARVTGETDTTPTKALGPVTQLIFGGLAPGNVAANVMSANATGGVGLHCGGSAHGPQVRVAARRESPAAVHRPALRRGGRARRRGARLQPARAGRERCWARSSSPPPARMVWAGVSKMLSVGLQALHPSARVGALCGALLGIALVLLDRWAPKKAKPFIPSAAGFGLAIVIPGSSSISFFIGAGIAEYLRRRKPKLAEAAVFPVGSGFIAGESLHGHRHHHAQGLQLHAEVGRPPARTETRSGQRGGGLGGREPQDRGPARTGVGVAAEAGRGVAPLQVPVALLELQVERVGGRAPSRTRPAPARSCPGPPRWRRWWRGCARAPPCRGGPAGSGRAGTRARWPSARSEMHRATPAKLARPAS